MPAPASATRYDAVLFDFGGVVVGSPFAAFEAIERRAGVPTGTVRRLNSTDPDTNAWARLERGDITARRFVAEFERAAAGSGVRLDAQALLDALVGLPAGRTDARPEMLTAVADLRAAGLRCGLLTNNIAPMAAREDTRWVHDAFDAVIESCVEGVRKPEPRSYQLACERLGVAPARVVFLDDLGINLKPARALGMTTIKVVDPQPAYTQLMDVLDLPAHPSSAPSPS